MKATYCPDVPIKEVLNSTAEKYNITKGEFNDIGIYQYSVSVLPNVFKDGSILNINFTVIEQADVYLNYGPDVQNSSKIPYSLNQGDGSTDALANDTIEVNKLYSMPGNQTLTIVIISKKIPTGEGSKFAFEYYTLGEEINFFESTYYTFFPNQEVSFTIFIAICAGIVLLIIGCVVLVIFLTSKGSKNKVKGHIELKQLDATN